MSSIFKIFVVSLFISVLFSACGEDATAPTVNETVLYEKSGLVDSAVVYGCYEYTVRHFMEDTLSFAGYTKVKVMFDGYTNTDGARIYILYNTESASNINVYEVEDQIPLNNIHTFEFNPPAEDAWFEVRLYISPPVCGPGEFKYVRARDIKIFGIR